MWIYHQVNGDLFKDLQWIARGYSGFEAGKNNPASQTVHDVGPIPQGNWSIGPPHDTPDHGPHVMRLTPDAATDTFGRDGFLIHGDSIANPGTASHGCVIMARVVRDQISSSGDNALQVI